MGEDWGDAASRLAALREVRTKMMMIVMIIVMMMVVMMVALVKMEMVIMAVDCGRSVRQNITGRLPSFSARRYFAL